MVTASQDRSRLMLQPRSADMRRHNLDFFLGATGRTGRRFLSDALGRGHIVTTYVRDATRLPAAISTHPNLAVFTGGPDETDLLAKAIESSCADAVFLMLASERRPYTAVSTGTLTTLQALRVAKSTGAADRPMPLISIGAWGLGPTKAYITRPATRAFVDIITRLFWSKPFADLEKQVLDLQAAKVEGLIEPILILPPILTNGKKMPDYHFGEARMMKGFMRMPGFVSRASLADLCLKIGEKAASGTEVPQWIGVINSQRRQNDRYRE